MVWDNACVLHRADHDGVVGNPVMSPAAWSRPTHDPGARPAPSHLVLGADDHGVARYASQLALACEAPVVRDLEAVTCARAPVHLHLTDRIIGPTPRAAAPRRSSGSPGGPAHVTLHDVPAADRRAGRSPLAPRRTRRIVRAARGWADQLRARARPAASGVRARRAGGVLPLPVLRPPRDRGRARSGAGARHLRLHLPRQGARQVVRASRPCAGAGIPARVLVVGGAAPGHDDEVADVVAMARARGVPARGDRSARRRRGGRRCCGRSPSRSSRTATSRRPGSLNSWLAAGRRPLVRDGAYAREMARAAPRDAHAVRRRRRSPTRSPTALRAAALDVAAPRRSTCARASTTSPVAYLAWWAGRDDAVTVTPPWGTACPATAGTSPGARRAAACGSRSWSATTSSRRELARTLDALARQTRAPDEVVVDRRRVGRRADGARRRAAGAPGGPRVPRRGRTQPRRRGHHG